MAIIPKQVTVGTSEVPLVVVPPGTGSVTITVAAANTVFVYIGTSSGVTTGNGAPIAGGSTVVIPGWPGSASTPLYAIASAASTPVGVFLSTAQ